MNVLRMKVGGRTETGLVVELLMNRACRTQIFEMVRWKVLNWVMDLFMEGIERRRRVRIKPIAGRLNVLLSTIVVEC